MSGRITFIVAFLVFTSACGPVGEMAKLQSSNLQNIGLGPVSPDLPTGGDDEEDGGGDEIWEGLKICSELDFENLKWSKNVAVDDRDWFALALNISGSFEGHLGWANLANNFDGQGLSMGLLNQNFGQGSLQPMMTEMRNGSLAAMQKIFSSTNYKSLNAMLVKWEASARIASLTLSDYGYSDLDDGALVAEDMGVDPLELEQVSVALLARNQASVDWAKVNLYSGKTFKKDWSTQLKALAKSAEYRSIQVRRAEALHLKALEMMALYKLTQLRSYLFFFDVVVQNGGISSTIRNQYMAWAKANPASTEIQRLNKILEFRLKLVKKEYVNDVRSRKASIINGTGTVHGEKRDYSKEFCTALSQKI